MTTRPDFLANGMEPVTNLAPDKDCPICCQTAVEDPNFMRLPCHHVYHAACIRGWVEQRGRNTCPLCREILFELLDDENEEDEEDEADLEEEDEVIMEVIHALADEVDGLLEEFPDFGHDFATAGVSHLMSPADLDSDSDKDEEDDDQSTREQELEDDFQALFVHMDLGFGIGSGAATAQAMELIDAGSDVRDYDQWALEMWLESESQAPPDDPDLMNFRSDGSDSD